MNNILAHLRTFVLAAGMAAASMVSSFAAPVVVEPGAPSQLQNVQADCYSIGQQVAAQNGGTLARASAANRGGRQVCVIVVLVPGKNGQRPRRAEFVVPAN